MSFVSEQSTGSNANLFFEEVLLGGMEILNFLQLALFSENHAVNSAKNLIHNLAFRDI